MPFRLPIVIASPRSGIDFAILCVAALWIVFRILLTPLGLEPDSVRYVVMGLNFAAHGVWSPEALPPDIVPKPGLGWGGFLTTLELALAIWLQPGAAGAMRCMAAAYAAGQDAGCPGIWSLKIFYAVEIVIFLFTVHRIAWLASRDSMIAAFAVLAALLCKDVFQYAHFILTEPLFLAALGLFMCAWLEAWLQQRRIYWFLAGVALGGVMLVKPAWSGLLPGLLLMMLWVALFDRTRRRAFLVGAALLPLGYALVAVPLLIRNGLQLGLWSLSDPGYLVGSLSHRLAFNRMTWTEWLMAWICYLPGIGGMLGAKLFGVEVAARLDWGPTSYYAYGQHVLHRDVLSRFGEAGGSAYLIRTYILEQPVKNAAVTLLLLIRGLFVGAWWGALALTLLLPAMWLMRGDRLRRWIIVALPAFGMALINAQASVNVVRYNLALIPVFALVFAIIAGSLCIWLWDRVRRRA